MRDVFYRGFWIHEMVSGQYFADRGSTVYVRGCASIDDAKRAIDRLLAVLPEAGC